MVYFVKKKGDPGWETAAKTPLEAYMMSTKTRIRTIRKHKANSS